jgi:acetyl esterase
MTIKASAGAATGTQLVGKLADPNMTLGQDPRADPRMLAALAPFGFDGEQPAPAVSPSSPRHDLLAFAQAAEDGFGAVFDALFQGLAPMEGVTHETISIDAADAHQITLYIHRPAGVDTQLPAVVHMHGGGAVILTAADACYRRWRDELAASGLVVVGVEFRNAAGALGNHPYPAGLNDCAAAVRWVAAHKSELGVGNVVVSGESGGGNLSLAVTLKAKQEGWVGEIDGVYAMAPMIASPWDKPPDLPSQQENDGYFISCALLASFGAIYDEAGKQSSQVTCWPWRASDEDLTGLPPHVISVNELDPLRDEGLAYQRHLIANGVSAVSRTVEGTVHAGDVFFRAAMPDVYASTIRNIADFARKVGR